MLPNEFDVWALSMQKLMLKTVNYTNKMWNLVIVDFIEKITPTILKTLLGSRNVQSKCKYICRRSTCFITLL